MRRCVICSLAVLPLSLAPSLASASPFGVGALSIEPAADPSTAAPTMGDEAPADASTDAPAPAAEEPVVPEPETAPEGPATGDEVDDAGAAPAGESPWDDGSGAPPPEGQTADTTAATTTDTKADGEMNRHAIGVRSGITVVPTWVLSGFLASHTNSLCRGDVGNFADDRGLTKVQGCNFFVGGEYIFRKSPVFDIAVSAGWQKMKAPDGIWLDSDECDSGGGNCNISAADYTEVDVSFAFIEADFIGRYPVVKTADVEVGIGGGGGIGLGIITGSGVFQTPLGPLAESQPPQDQGTCNAVADFSDLRKCSPHYGADEDLDPVPQGEAMAEWSDPSNFPFVSCSKDECNEKDMELMGGRVKNEDVPPVIPVVNLILSTRVIVKDVWSIDLRGGWNTGFYFGGAMAYHFSGKSKKK